MIPPDLRPMVYISLSLSLFMAVAFVAAEAALS